MQKLWRKFHLCQLYYTKNFQGNLVSIGSGVENDFVRSLIDDNDAWIGGVNLDHPNLVVWIDGSEFKYSNWYDDEPDDDGYNCIYMDGDEGTWYDDECDTYYDYVCQIVLKSKGKI